MDKDLRNQLANAVQAIRRLLEEEFARQLEGTFDVFPDGRISAQPSAPLTAEQRFVREKIIAAIQHRCSKGESVVEAVYGYTRECAYLSKPLRRAQDDGGSRPRAGVRVSRR